MATTQIEERPRIILPRASRRNEILAILLLALGLLLALCLISAAFYPNDPSWNSAGQTVTHNWAGSIGANVAATAFQFIGLAAYLLPLLLFAAAWRRFHTSAIHSPLTRIVGLIVLVVAASALLSISQLRPLFDASVQPGGLLGAVVAQGLASGLNNVGATVLLVAIAATGLLLATNFSFVRLYEIIVNAIGTRFAFVGRIPERFKAWQQMRAEQATLRKETKAAIKAEREATKHAMRQTLNLSPAERVADFMKEPVPEPNTVIRAEQNALQLSRSNDDARGECECCRPPGRCSAASPATVVTGRSGKLSIFPGSGSEGAVADEDDDLEEMVKGRFGVGVQAENPPPANSLRRNAKS